MKNKKPIYVGIVAVMVIIIGVAIVLALTGNSQQTYTAKIAEGQKQLEAGNYDDALVLFKSAINMEPTKTDAYTMLYQAYMGAGYRDLARMTLMDGIDKTQSVSLQLLLEENFGVFDTLEEEPSDTTQAETLEDKQIQPVLNTDLLSFFAGASYDDYRMKYGTVTCSESGGVYTARADGLEADLIYYNTSTARVIDSGKGVPYSNFAPNEISVDNVAVLFGGASGFNFEKLRSLNGVNDPAMVDNVITFTANGCTVSITCGDDGIIRANAENTIVPSGAAEVGELTLKGTVVDASNGNGVSGARVKVYAGRGTFGNYTEDTSDSQGDYSVALSEGGYYTIVVTKNGYIEENFEIYVSGSNRETEADLPISPELAADQIRLVLTWGASPTDLDSWLLGQTDSGKDVRVYYGDRIAYDSNGDLIAALDVDERNGYGPETITIYNLNGVYHFAVVDFTGSGTMSSSGAQVKVYKGSELVETVDICSGLENGWSVLKIDHGEVTVTNTVQGTTSVDGK